MAAGAALGVAAVAALCCWACPFTIATAMSDIHDPSSSFGHGPFDRGD